MVVKKESSSWKNWIIGALIVVVLVLLFVKPGILMSPEESQLLCFIAPGVDALRDNCADDDWVQRTTIPDQDGDGIDDVFEVPYVNCRKDTSMCTAIQNGNWPTVNPRAPCDILNDYTIEARLQRMSVIDFQTGESVRVWSIAYYCNAPGYSPPSDPILPPQITPSSSDVLSSWDDVGLSE